jgi:hypothetical protein
MELGHARACGTAHGTAYGGCLRLSGHPLRPGPLVFKDPVPLEPLSELFLDLSKYDHLVLHFHLVTVA